jgi:hypothetical protein
MARQFQKHRCKKCCHQFREPEKQDWNETELDLKIVVEEE